MNIEKFYETIGQNYQVVLKRMMGNTDFLSQMLNKFTADRTFHQLEEAVHDKNVSNIFENAHTLKGVSENLGLKPLYDELFELVELTRHGSIEGADKAFEKVKKAYLEMIRLLNLVDLKS